MSALEKAWEPHTPGVTPAGGILESQGKTPECALWKMSLGGFSRLHINLVSSTLGGWHEGRQFWSLCSPLGSGQGHQQGLVWSCAGYCFWLEMRIFLGLNLGLPSLPPSDAK